jgi:hypothetical protein
MIAWCELRNRKADDEIGKRLRLSMPFSRTGLVSTDLVSERENCTILFVTKECGDLLLLSSRTTKQLSMFTSTARNHRIVHLVFKALSAHSP